MNKNNPLLVTTDHLPQFFPGLNPKTMAILRSQGKGPRYYRRERKIYYDVEEVRRWLTEFPVGKDNEVQP